jgi:hypothetical protein
MLPMECALRRRGLNFTYSPEFQTPEKAKKIVPKSGKNAEIRNESFLENSSRSSSSRPPSRSSLSLDRPDPQVQLPWELYEYFVIIIMIQYKLA